MNCIIPGNNMKVIHKALLSLGRFSDELYIECKPNSLQFVTMNMSKTVYAKFNFLSVFFITYSVDDPQTQSTDMGDSLLTCKVYTKAMQSIFKPKMDKNVENCRMEIDKEGIKLNFELKYKTNVKNSHSIRLLDFDYLTINYSTEEASNNLLAPGQFFAQVLSNFNPADLNLNLEVEKGKITYRNYDAMADSSYKGMRSAVVLNASEFITYRVREETNILMSLKSFRNVVNFSEHFNLHLDIYFNTDGCPVIVVIKNPTFEVDFVLSTHNRDEDTEISSKKPELQNNMRLTQEDRQVLENVNWENDFSESDKNSSNVRNLVDKIVQENLLTEDEDVVGGSPEREPPKKIAKVFERCFDPTFHTSMLNFGDVLAEDSDPDD